MVHSSFQWLLPQANKARWTRPANAGGSRSYFTFTLCAKWDDFDESWLTLYANNHYFHFFSPSFHFSIGNERFPYFLRKTQTCPGNNKLTGKIRGMSNASCSLLSKKIRQFVAAKGKSKQNELLRQFYFSKALPKALTNFMKIRIAWNKCYYVIKQKIE